METIDLQRIYRKRNFPHHTIIKNLIFEVRRLKKAQSYLCRKLKEKAKK